VAVAVRDPYAVAVDRVLARKRPRSRLTRLRAWRPRWYRRLRLTVDVLAALEWYADARNWRVEVCDTTLVDGRVQRTFAEPPVRMDSGRKAREALGYDYPEVLEPVWHFSKRQD